MRASLSLCALVLFLGSGLARAESIDKSFHESFEVKPGAALHLRSGDGDVELAVWDQPRIEVKVEYHYEQKGLHWGKDRKEFNVTFRQQGDDLWVEEDHGGHEVSFQVGSSTQHEYLYTIQAPAWVVLDIEGEDGDIRVANWDASIEVVCDDGSVEVLDSKGEHFEFTMQDGDLTLTRCAADIDVELDDGDIDCEAVTTQAFALEAQDGKIDLDLIGSGAVEWEVLVDDGDVRLQCAGDIDAKVEIETDDGSIRVETEMGEDGRQRENRFSGKLGSGQGRIRLRGQDGDIDLLHDATTP